MLFCCEAKTQTNLVPNGSFEDYTICPNGLGEVYKSNNWFDPTNATSDYFNSCSVNGISSLPTNYYGFTYAFHGNSCMGLATFEDSISSINWREYIGVKLLEKTKTNTTYCFSSYIKPAGRFTGFSNNFGILLLNDTSNIFNFYPENITYPSIANNSNIIFDTLQWTKVFFEFETNTSFEYLIIGNFSEDKNTLISNSNNALGFTGAYYYIDSVSLIDCSSIVIPNIFTPNNDGVNDVWRCAFSAFETVNCSIYNRWGNLIFQSNKQIIQWDGRTTSGINCEDGIYFYCIETEAEKHKGHIQLIR